MTALRAENELYQRMQTPTLRARIEKALYKGVDVGDLGTVKFIRDRTGDKDSLSIILE